MAKAKNNKGVRELLDQFQKKEITLDQAEDKIMNAVYRKVRGQILEELADEQLEELISGMEKECNRIEQEAPVD